MLSCILYSFDPSVSALMIALILVSSIYKFLNSVTYFLSDIISKIDLSLSSKIALIVAGSIYDLNSLLTFVSSCSSR